MGTQKHSGHPCVFSFDLTALGGSKHNIGFYFRLLEKGKGYNMIVIAVTYKAKPGKREAALRAAKTCAETTRREAGNIDYTFYAGSTPRIPSFSLSSGKARRPWTCI